MRWTKVTTTWLGTDLEKRGRWHGVPYVVRGHNLAGTAPRGWVVVALAALLLVATVLVDELLP